MQHAKFPFICTNYDFSDTILKEKTLPWKIIEKGEFRIGIIGLGINPDGLISPPNYEGMKWLDPIKTGEETARFLKKEKKCNLVVALSHLGYKSAPNRPESDVKQPVKLHQSILLLGDILIRL
jgi:5'-nucleotidase